MKRKYFLILFSALSLQIAVGQKVITLWPNGAPGNNECPKPEEIFNGRIVWFVSEPTLTIYLPEKDKNTK